MSNCKCADDNKRENNNVNDGNAQCIRIGVMEDNFDFGHILHIGHSLFFCIRVKNFSAFYWKAIIVDRMGMDKKSW